MSGIASAFARHSREGGNRSCATSPQSGRRAIPAFAGMTMLRVCATWLTTGILFAATASAQDLLIRHATVHTAGAQGTLRVKGKPVQGIPHSLRAKKLQSFFRLEDACGHLFQNFE